MHAKKHAFLFVNTKYIFCRLRHMRDEAEGYVDWLKDHEWAYFITLHFTSEFKPKFEVAESKVRKLCTRLNKFLNGKDLTTKLSVFAVYETSKADVPHVHICLGSENKLNKSIGDVYGSVAYYWGKQIGCMDPVRMGEGNKGWFTDTDDNKDKIIGYMCKEFNIGRNPVLVGALKLPSTK